MCLLIENKGGGIKHNTEAKGALSIVSLMAKEMDIDWEITSSQEGTLYLSQNLNEV
ncbi:hypothetical protein J14TS2_42040 [Bacillus sp. J14TS2]|nr:hypothetical protein J14TS2_42040 [Bacillus sp. J14TS2]